MVENPEEKKLVTFTKLIYRMIQEIRMQLISRGVTSIQVSHLDFQVLKIPLVSFVQNEMHVIE